MENTKNDNMEKLRDSLSGLLSDELTESSAYIMDVFEEILAENNIYIPNEDRTGAEEEACVYGETYYEMESKVEDELMDFLMKLVEKYNPQAIE